MIKKISLCIIFCLVACTWYLSPILKPFPKPTGPYSIGTTSFHCIDQTRKDPYAPTDQNRSVIVRLWYPTDAPSCTAYPYLGSKKTAFEKQFSQLYGIPYFLSRLFWRGITTHASEKPFLASSHKPYPVILFSHGLLGTPSDTYVSLIENLASHGYIVAALDHPFFNILTQYPDGTIITSHSLSTHFNRMRSTEQYEFLSKAIEAYKTDMNCVITQLQALNQDTTSIFYQGLDLHKLGIMGHSAGGTAAIEFCRTNNRCKAAADLDGWYDHVIGHEPLHKPLLLMFGSKSIEVTEPTLAYLKRKELTREQYYERERIIAQHKQELCTDPLCSMIIIPGAAHGDFSDTPLLKWPFRAWNDVDSYATLALINESILKFFQKYLH